MKTIKYRGASLSVGKCGAVIANSYTDTGGASRKQKECIQTTSQQGYSVIGLRRDYKHMCLRVHRLVAMAYLEEYDEGCIVDHINRIKTDNRLVNLRIVSRAINARNSRRCDVKCHDVCKFAMA